VGVLEKVEHAKRVSSPQQIGALLNALDVTRVDVRGFRPKDRAQIDRMLGVTAPRQ
jgi:hypothetical protein